MITEKIKKIEVINLNKKENLSKYVSFLVGKYGEIPTDEQINQDFNGCIKKTKVRFVIVSLNQSSGLKDNWENFHIKYRNNNGVIDYEKTVDNDGAKRYFELILQDYPEYRGSYMTDFYKGVIDPNAASFMKIIKARRKTGKVDYEKYCVELFEKELAIVSNNFQEKIVLIAVGKDVYEAIKYNQLDRIYPLYRCTSVSRQNGHFEKQYKTWGEPLREIK